MSNIYTPGLTISRNTFVRKERRLPLKGEILVNAGEMVDKTKIVARTEIEGILGTVKAAGILGVPAGNIEKYLKVSLGDTVKKGDTIASATSFFGIFKSECKSPYTGKLEMISDITGNVGIRLQPTPIEVDAYIDGTVSEKIGDDGVVIETRASLVQGIFGIGGEKHGVISVVAKSPDEEIYPEQITSCHNGKIIVAGATFGIEVLRKASTVGAVGIIAGAMPDTNIKKYLGYDIGVTITGEENVKTTVILTEGFGSIPMSKRAFDILKALDGKEAAINGTTHIRAGVIRPEIISEPIQKEYEDCKTACLDLAVGTRVRIISHPYFCKIAEITKISDSPELLPSGAVVRVVYAKLENGEAVKVPLSNIELIQT